MKTKTMPRTAMMSLIFALTGVTFDAGCWVRADAHCGNLEGDATCAGLGSGPYCNTCIAAGNGCTDREPSPECRIDVLSTETTAWADPSTSAETAQASGAGSGLGTAGELDEGTTQSVATGSGSLGDAQTSTGVADTGVEGEGTTGAGDPLYPPCSLECYLEGQFCYPPLSFDFAFCTHSCKNPGDCEQPDSGEAIAECIPVGNGICALDCSGGHTCPDGMICYEIAIDGQTRHRCGWP